MAIAAAILVGGLCAGLSLSAAKESKQKKMETAAPPPEAAEILAASKDYEKWPRFSEYKKPKYSTAHQHMWVIGYYNQIAGESLARAPSERPANGSIFVKENRLKKDEPPATITISSVQNGRWYWIEASPDLSKIFVDEGKPLAGSDVAGCRNCHEKAPNGVFSKGVSRDTH